MIYEIALLHSPEGTVIARCPSLPGCIAKGRNDREALDNIKEAITAWMWNADLHVGKPMQLPMAG
jgi:predicted RNase H-like HicB family nuclease